MKPLLTVVCAIILLSLPLAGQTVVPEWDEYIAEQIESGAIGEDESRGSAAGVPPPWRG